MSFLDRFKTSPKYRHPDAAIRLEAIAELDPDDPEQKAAIAELAVSDADVKVRRTAADRLYAAADLAPLLRAERDDEMRRTLADRLVSIANASDETAADAALALDALTDAKQLGAVAKGSPHETVRTAALARIEDARTLGSVARHAGHPRTAEQAVARLTDHEELTAVALKTDHRDAGVAALDRVTAALAGDAERRALLETIAVRARNKSIAKRARGLLQEMDEADETRRGATAARQQRIRMLLSQVDAVAASPGASDARVRLDHAEEGWRHASAADTKKDDDLDAQFTSRLAEARAAIARHEQEAADRRAGLERIAVRRAALVAVCEHVDTLRGEDIPAQLDASRARWAELVASTDDANADIDLRARFDDACRRAEARHANRQDLARVHERLDALSKEAEGIAAQDGTADAWTPLAAEWRSLSARVDNLDPAIATRFNDAAARMHQRDGELRAAAERTLRQQVQRLDQLIDRVEKRSAAEDLTLREADRVVRDLKTAIDAPPTLESREQHALLARLKAALELAAPRLHDLRELDEWKRFANAAVQEELIARTEALRIKYALDAADGPTADNVEKAARDLHEIQERWKQVAEAPRAQAQTLWHRYRQAADPIQNKAREVFAQRAEERGANLQQKLALVARAEALADSTDWIKTADEMKQLQADWQKVGPVPRQEMKDTWKRFRDACDRFFTRRNADLAQRKEAWSGNLARKEALCARAEELATSRDWDRTAAEIRRLQAEWKTIGPVRRQKSEAIWERFRAACDAFFERFKRKDEIELETKQADREALIVELDALRPSGEPDTAAPTDLLERVRALRTRWNQTTPVVRSGADPLSARFQESLARLLDAAPEAFRGTELDVEASRQKMEKLVARVEGLLAEGGAAKPSSSSQALAEMLREALAANTIGGRAGDENKWKVMADEVRQAQQSWSRLGPVPGEQGSQLGDRFNRACNRFFEVYRRKVPPPQPQRGGHRPVGAR